MTRESVSVIIRPNSEYAAEYLTVDGAIDFSQINSIEELNAALKIDINLPEELEGTAEASSIIDTIKGSVFGEIVVGAGNWAIKNSLKSLFEQSATGIKGTGIVVGIAVDTVKNSEGSYSMSAMHAAVKNCMIFLLASPVAGIAMGGMICAGLLASAAGVAVIAGTWIAAGFLVNELLNKPLFSDGASLKDYLDNQFKEWINYGAGVSLSLDADLYASDLYNLAKSSLNSFLEDATTISSYLQSTFNSLTSAEQSTSRPRVDPLTLDLDGDGVELIDVRNSQAFFDLDLHKLSNEEYESLTNPASPSYNPSAQIYSLNNPDGTVSRYIGDGVKEQVGWVKGDDGLLVLDKNNNGTIDNIIELFGKQDKTGTEELREYDLNDAAGANGISDGVINNQDAIFSKLKIWQDINKNGISEENELKYLTELGIKEIKVSPDSVTNQNSTQNGNLIISTGQFIQETTNPDGTISDIQRTYANLDLAVNQANSASYTYTDQEGNIIGNYDLNLETLSLPMSRGYGNIKALPIAASQNPALLKVMKELANLLDSSPQSSAMGGGEVIGGSLSSKLNSINSRIEEIIYLLTNTTNITENRGAFDGKKLAALEAIRGEEYTTMVNGQQSHNVEIWQSAQVQNAWDQLLNSMKIKLLTQSTFKDIFSKTITTETTETITNEDGTTSEITTTSSHLQPASYNFATDSINFNGLTKTELYQTIQSKLNSITNSSSDAVDETTKDWINNIYTKADKINFLNQIKEILQVISNGSASGNASISGLNASDLPSDFQIFTAAVDIQNIILSTTKDDNLSGGYNPDGSNGDDVYLFNKGDGKDVIDESGRGGYFYNDEQTNQDNGIDTILFGAGIVREDVYFTRSGSGDLIIKFRNSGDQIEVRYPQYVANRVEELRFANGETVDISDLSKLIFEYHGSDAGETLIGSEGNDVINAGNGNDVVGAYDGNDVISGGRGDDLLSGGKGNDIYKFALGDGVDVINEFGTTLPGYKNRFETGIQIDSYNSNGTGTPGAFIDHGVDVIEFAFGIEEQHLRYFQNNNDLIITFTNSADDVIVIKDHFTGTAASTVENLKFFYQQKNAETGELLFDEQGNPLLEEKIIDLKNKDWSQIVMEVAGSVGNDRIFLPARSSIIKAVGGDDSIESNYPNHSYAHEIYGEDGNDTITIGGGNDIISGGRGDDILNGGTGNEAYVFNLGDGKDEVCDYGGNRQG